MIHFHCMVRHCLTDQKVKDVPCLNFESLLIEVLQGYSAKMWISWMSYATTGTSKPCDKINTRRSVIRSLIQCWSDCEACCCSVTPPVSSLWFGFSLSITSKIHSRRVSERVRVANARAVLINRKQMRRGATNAVITLPPARADDLYLVNGCKWMWCCAASHSHPLPCRRRAAQPTHDLSSLYWRCIFTLFNEARRVTFCYSLILDSIIWCSCTQRRQH